MKRSISLSAEAAALVEREVSETGETVSACVSRLIKQGSQYRVVTKVYFERKP